MRMRGARWRRMRGNRVITLEQYFGNRLDHPEATPQIKANTTALLANVNALLADAQANGVPCLVNPSTGSLIAGCGEGGFRLCNCTQGSRTSSHKEGRGVDIYDPQNKLDRWINDKLLMAYGLYREHPDATSTWVHLTDRAPPSKRRTFWP